MGISFLIIGFLFFFLPNFSIIDLFPDFLGCLFVIKGLSKLADLTPGLSDAKDAFLKVTYIYVAKFFLMFSVPFFGNTDGGYILIFSFVFGILDLIFTLPAFKTLLNGFLYLGDRTNASSLFKNHSELSTMTSIFFVVRAALVVLQDLSYISTPDMSGIVATNGFYLSNYRTLLVAFNFVVTGIIGFIWIVFAVNYFRGIKRDKTLIGFLSDQYKTKVLPNTSLFTRRAVKNSYLMFTLASILMIDFMIDYVNFVPDFIGGLLFICGTLFLKKYVKTKEMLISSIIFTVFSLASWIVLAVYAVKFPDVYISTNMQAYSMFRIVNLFNILKYASAILLFINIFKLYKDIIKLHTGSAVDELASISVNTRLRQIEMTKNNNIMLVLGILTCASGIFRMIMLYNIPAFLVFDIGINLVWFICAFKLYGKVNEAVEYKYL